MLKLLAWREVIVPRRHRRQLPDAMTAAEGRQRLIGERRPLGCQFFLHPHQIPFAVGQQFQDLLPVRFGFLGRDSVGTCVVFDRRTLRTVKRESFQRPRNLVLAHSLGVELPESRSVGLDST